MSLLGLPTELLDEIAQLLDENYMKDVPNVRTAKRHLQNLSLTCARLRDSAIPHLFKDASLHLFWVNDRLQAPPLLHFKRYPHLRKHVRRLYIKPDVEMAQRYEADWDTDEELARKNDYAQDWRRSLPKDLVCEPYGTPEDLHWKERRRTDDAVRKLLQPPDAESVPPGTFGPGKLLEMMDRIVCPTEKEKAHALAIVLLCIPASTTAIVLESAPVKPANDLPYRFALRVLTAAMDLFQDKIDFLAVDASEAPNRMYRQASQGEDLLDTIIPKDTLDALRIRHLALTAVQQRTPVGQYTLSGLPLWSRLSRYVGVLDLVDTTAPAHQFLQLVEACESLKALRVYRCELVAPQLLPGQIPRNKCSLWLDWCIAVRNSMPGTRIHLDTLYTLRKDQLPMSAVRWISSQAVARYAVIDDERHQRLSEDFLSFLPLWDADDGARGIQAMKEWEGGKLADEAMSRRRLW